eukprot:m.1324271 g.1324271  ORF g.1324271 m.1324271 type:complete len:890 (-) comp24852_c2_seq5:2578-5247(-)
MGDIVEGRHDALSTRDADVHAMLRQLRHEYDILQREKREMEIYCDDVERDRMEKDSLVAGLRSDRDQLQRQVQEAGAQTQRIYELECEVITQKETVMSMRRQQRQNTLQCTSGLSSPCVSDDSGLGDRSPVVSMSPSQLSSSIFTIPAEVADSHTLRKEITRVENVLDELIVHLHASIEKEGSSEGTGDSSHISPEESGQDPSGLLLRSELEAEYKAAKAYIAQLEDDLIAVRERSRQWEDVTNTLEIDVEALTHELKHEREERMRLQDYSDELLGMLHSQHDQSTSSQEAPHVAGHVDADVVSVKEGMGTLADEIGLVRRTSAVASQGTLEEEMDAVGTAHGGVDFTHSSDGTGPAVVKPLASPRKSLAVPDNLKELIYSKPIQMPSCTRLGDMMTVPDDTDDLEMDTSPLQSTPMHAPANRTRQRRHPDVSMSPISTPEGPDWNKSASGSPDEVASRCMAVAVYAFTARDAEVELCVNKGEVVVVLHGEVADEWWLVKNKSGLRGYVPRDYLDPTDDVTLKQEVRRLRQDKMSHKGCPTAVRNTSGTTLIARFDYITSKPKELGFVKGEELSVVSMDAEKQWWQAQNATGDVGFVPVTYLRKPLPSSPGRPSKPPAAATALAHGVGVLSPCKTNDGNGDDAVAGPRDTGNDTPAHGRASGDGASGSSTLVAHVGSRLHSLRAAAAGVGGWLRRARPSTTTHDAPDGNADGGSGTPTRAADSAPPARANDGPAFPNNKDDASVGRTPDAGPAAAGGTSWFNALSSRRVWSSVEQGVGKTKQRLLQKWSATGASPTKGPGSNEGPPDASSPSRADPNNRENVPPGDKNSSPARPGRLPSKSTSATTAQDAKDSTSNDGPSWMAMALARAEQQKRTTTSPMSDVGHTYDI